MAGKNKSTPLQGLLADPVEQPLFLGKGQLAILGCPQENFHALGRQALEEFIDIGLSVGHHRGFDASGAALTSLEWRGQPVVTLFLFNRVFLLAGLPSGASPPVQVGQSIEVFLLGIHRQGGV